MKRRSKSGHETSKSRPPKAAAGRRQGRRRILERFTQAALAVMAQDDIKNRVVALGYTPIAGGPDAVRERIAKNVPFFKELIANAKIPQIE